MPRTSAVLFLSPPLWSRVARISSRSDCRVRPHSGGPGPRCTPWAPAELVCQVVQLDHALGHDAPFQLLFSSRTLPLGWRVPSGTPPDAWLPLGWLIASAKYSETQHVPPGPPRVGGKLEHVESTEWAPRALPVWRPSASDLRQGSPARRREPHPRPHAPTHPTQHARAQSAAQRASGYLVEEQGSNPTHAQVAASQLSRAQKRHACTNNLFRSVGVIAPQSSGMKGLWRRELSSTIAWATSSFPVPLSPMMRTVASVGATLVIRS